MPHTKPHYLHKQDPHVCTGPRHSFIHSSKQRNHKNEWRPGFTIVELLIVIVVIAILAAISIVAYNGIQNRADASRRIAAVSQVKKQLRLSEVDKGSLPGDGYKSTTGCMASTCVFGVHKTARYSSSDYLQSGPHGSGRTQEGSSLSPQTFRDEYGVDLPDGFSYLNINNKSYLITLFRNSNSRPDEARVPAIGEPLFPLSGFMTTSIVAPARVESGYVVCSDGTVMGEDMVVAASSVVPISTISGDNSTNLVGNGIYLNQGTSVISCSGHGGGQVSVGFPFVDYYLKGSDGKSFFAAFKIN